MKLVLATLFLAGLSLFSTGCSDLAYSGSERMQQIGRNWSNEGGVMVEEIDNLLLLRPQSRLMYWNIR